MQSHLEPFSTLFGTRRNFENIAYSYVHDHDVAKDIVNDVFMHLWEHRDEIDWDNNIKGYVYMGVRARCISWLRKKQTLDKAHDDMRKTNAWKTESSIVALGVGGMPERLFSGEVQSIYRTALERMPELTRDVFLASREDDCTYQEIAYRYGITMRKVTAEMQKALRLLRKALKDYIN